MSCEENQEVLLAYVYGELSEEEQAALEAHLEFCASCRGELHSFIRGRELLASWEPPVASADLFQRLENRIERAREKSRRHEHLGLNIQLAIGIAAIIFFALLVLLPSRRQGGLFASPVQVIKQAFKVTIFNQDLALVKDHRLILNLKAGENLVRFDDVPALMQPDSVRFRSLTDPKGCRVLEQNFEYDLASAGAVLEKYIDRKVTCVMKDGGTQEGFLKSYEGSWRGRSGRLLYGQRGRPSPYQMKQQLERSWLAPAGRGEFRLRQVTLSEEQGGGKTYIIDARQIQAIRFAEMPEGLLSKPTLVWKLEVPRGSRHEVEVSYLTNGMDWQAHYRAQVKPGDKIDFEGWVTANNNSGATFKEAGLKLLAGDVHIIQPPPAVYDNNVIISLSGGRELADLGPQFVEKPLFEYHLYTLTRETTLNDRQVKQIMFVFPTFDIPCKRTYIYHGAKFEKYRGYDTSHRVFGTECNTKVNVMLEFENSERHRLGMPLPKGVVRLYQDDGTGESQFIGEDVIDHTPREEKVELYVGNAFDITGRRRQTNYELDTNLGYAEESFEIKLHNAKSQPVTVKVQETMYRWVNWKIVKSSHKFDKLDARRIEFPIEVEPGSRETVTYTVLYTWRGKHAADRRKALTAELEHLRAHRDQLEAHAKAVIQGSGLSDSAKKELAEVKAIDARIKKLEDNLRKSERIYEKEEEER